MNKAQLIELIAEKSRTTKNQSESILDATIEVIMEALRDGEEVKLVGFGTFSKTTRKSRTGRNPKTGATVKIPSTHVPRFKPGKDLKDFIK
ncbi:DNA-binding protein HU-alpha [compost metagenome]